MENIYTKEQLQAELDSILQAKAKSNETVSGYNKQVQELAQKKNSELVELAKLNGEERVITRLLSTLDNEQK